MMRFLALLLLLTLAIGSTARAVPAAGFTQPDAEDFPDLFVWQDTCNVYILRDGDAALLIDLGDGSVVAHNSAILEEGYIHGAELLSRLQPDILIGAHSFVMDRPAAFIERYRQWSYEMRDGFQALSFDPDYRYGYDPFWVRACPYRTTLRPGASAELTLHVRNFRQTTQTHRIEIHAPPGIVVEPAVLTGELAHQSQDSFPIRIAASGDVGPGTQLVALDVTLDGQRYGQRFDFLVGVNAE